MKKDVAKKNDTKQSLRERYRQLPKQLHSRSVKKRSEAQKLLTITICVPLMLACLGYMVYWELNRQQIERDNAAYSQLYQPATATAEASLAVETPAAGRATPTAEPTSLPTASPSASPTVKPSPAPSAAAERTEMPSASPSPIVSEEPTQIPTAEPTPAPSPSPTIEPSATAKPTPEATPMPTFPIAIDATRMPVPTPGEDTIVYALETPPPVQESFARLLELNPDTIGYLTVGESISLPVVQRKNDNDHYLNHAFDGKASEAGALFLDGSNLLVPEDPVLMVYGHNMRNGTMFHNLTEFSDRKFLRENPLVQFDTIYENRSYVPFAAFTASMDEDSSHYMSIRQFAFDEASFNRYISRIRALSIYDSKVDVQYGDSVLLLVTCEYVTNDGRFVVALREIRPDESEADMRKLVRQTKLR